MRVALDSFEVEGIGHNLPFLSAVMDHPIFIAGEMTTAFIAEEYPDGFEGVELAADELRRIAAALAAMHRVAEIRRARVSGRMDNHERKVGSDWNVALQGQSFDVTIAADQDGATVGFPDGDTLRVCGDWTPGDQLAVMTVGEVPLVLKVGKISGGFRVRTRGADLRVHVRTPRQAELARLMPEKQAPDTSKMLLCPMPGLVVKLDVAVGDAVHDGQALCTIEAMKMENILRAEKNGVVSKINASAGDSLAVDDVILEFE
jgi:propionyl-CoA carboxylase alpha chain